MRDLLLTFLLICVTAIWGSTFVVVQDAIEKYPVIPFLAIRFIVATITLASVSSRQVMTWWNSHCWYWHWFSLSLRLFVSNTWPALYYTN